MKSLSTYYLNGIIMMISTKTRGGFAMGIAYKKFEPTEYVMKVKKGKAIQKGLGFPVCFFGTAKSFWFKRLCGGVCTTGGI